MYDSDARTAMTISFVAIIIDLVFFLILLLSSFFIYSLGLATFYSSLGMPIAFLSGLFLAFAVVELLWLPVTSLFIYRPLREGEAHKAETPSLLIGIGQLIFGGFLSGILLLIAWIKIRDSLRMQQKYGKNDEYFEP